MAKTTEDLAIEAVLAEPKADVKVNEHISEYEEGVPTLNPALNLKARSNIVSDGRY